MSEARRISTISFTVASILVGIVALSYAIARVLPLPRAWPLPPSVRAVGAALALASIGGLVWLMRHRSFGRVAVSTAHTLRWALRHEEARGVLDEGLVTTGPHRLVRHPIYTCALLLALGLALATAWPFLTIACVLLFGWYRFVVIPMEERELVERFGEAYERYRQRTPALVPRLRAMR